MNSKLVKLATFLFTIFAPVLCQATTVDFYEDGTIQDGDVYEIVHVWDTATVTMTGGQVDQLYTCESSTINFYAGTVNSISLQNNSTLNLDGYLACNDFGMSHSTELYINSGTFDGKIRGSGNKITVNAGSVSIRESQISNYTLTNIYGGTVTFNDILFDRYATLNIYGGDVTFIRDSFGDAFRLGLWASFNVFYTDIIYNENSEIAGYHLLSGHSFMLDQFTALEVSKINFVPEPLTLLLLALGIPLVRRKR